MFCDEEINLNIEIEIKEETFEMVSSHHDIDIDEQINLNELDENEIKDELDKGQKGLSKTSENLNENEIIDKLEQGQKGLSKNSEDLNILADDQVLGFMCDQCDYFTKHKGNLNTHLKVRHEKRSFKCLQCDFTTYFKQYLQKHMNEKHGVPVMYFCSDCDYCNEDKQEYNMHKKTEHTPVKKPKKYNLDKKLTQWKVKPFQDKKQKEKETISINAEELKTEVEPKLENSTKQFTCDSCDYSTDRKPTLNIHKQAVHVGHLDFSCDSCPFTTTTKEYLVRHIQRGHPELDNSRPYPLVTPEIELPEHKFHTKSQLPILFIDGFVLKMNKYRLNHQGQKCAYFYCNEKSKHRCKV